MKAEINVSCPGCGCFMEELSDQVLCCYKRRCPQHGIRYKLPTVELEPVEPLNIRDELDIDFSPNPPESDPATYRHECGCERVVDGTRGQFSVFGQQFNALCIDAVNMHGAIERTGSLLEHIAAIDAGYKASRKRQQDDTVWMRGPYGLQGSASYKAKSVKDEQQQPPTDPIPVHVGVDEEEGSQQEVPVPRTFTDTCGCAVFIEGPQQWMPSSICDIKYELLANGKIDEAKVHTNKAVRIAQRLFGFDDPPASVFSSEYREMVANAVRNAYAPPQPNDDRPKTAVSQEEVDELVNKTLKSVSDEKQKRVRSRLQGNLSRWRSEQPAQDKTADEHTLGETKELPIGKWCIQADSEIFGADNGSPCPDCNATGKYHGLNTIEDCGTCGGTGRV